MGNKLLVAVVAGLLLAGVGVGTASADDSHPGGDWISGDGTFALATFKFHADNDSDDPFDADGYFAAESTSPADALVAPQGPVTCLEVDGNRAGFLYPLEDETRPAILKGQVIKITVVDGGDGTDHVGFVGPAPAAAFPDCAPGLAPFEVTEGDVEVHDGSDDR